MNKYSWERQDEDPILVISPWFFWRNPDGKPYISCLYADGTVMSEMFQEYLTPEQVQERINMAEEYRETQGG